MTLQQDIRPHLASELVAEPDVEVPSIARIVDHLPRIVDLKGDERTIGQIVGLEQHRKALQRRTGLEFICDLRIALSAQDPLP
jgi:hypothetical protein